MKIRTREEIIDSLVDNFSLNMPTYEGTMTHAIFSILATAIEREYVIKDEEHKQVFIEEGSDEFLDKRAREFGYIRKEGSNSKGILTFVGEEGKIIPASLEVFYNGVQFELSTQGKIGSNGECDIECCSVELGAYTNVKSGSDFTCNDNEIVRIFNKNDIEGGRDVETDDDFKTRFFYLQQHKATSGNVYHYEKWATDVEGVSKAIVKPLWNGNGTVKVIISNNNVEVDSEVVKNCEAHINEQKPIGADVTVVTLKKYMLDLKFSVRLVSSDKQTIENKVRDLLQQYFKTRDVLVVDKVKSLIYTIEDIEEIQEFKLNEKTTGRLEITDEQYYYINSIDCEVV